MDLRDAYFSVHINVETQNFLKFERGGGGGQLFKFTAFLKELVSCPRLFSKLLKPVMAALHRRGFISTIFIDNTLVIGLSELECIRNIKASLELLGTLGFVVHPCKSVLTSSHTITYLGFDINSSKMTITLTRERKEKIYSSSSKLLNMSTVSAQTLANLICQVVASFLGVTFGKLQS